MKKKNGNGNGNGGFTLLEVILSIAILGLITVPLMKYFSDSLRYTALTARQQKATLLAQETIESLKVQDKLINRTADAAGNLYYWVTSLSGKDETVETGEEYEAVDYSGFHKNNGTTDAGKPLVLKKTVTRGDLDFDVLLYLSTDVDANAVARPVIYGVNDTRNVMMVERDQEQEALLYFLALNTSYVVNHAGGATPDPGTPTPTPTPAATPDPAPADPPAATPAPVELLGSVDNVRKLLQRDIYITIGKETVDPYYYTVQADYVYSCSKVTNEDKSICPTSNIMSTRIEKLESLYLLFNMVDPEKDIIHIKWDTDLPASESVAPELVLVCQNLDQLKGADAEGTPDPAATPTPTPTPGADPGYTPFAFEADQYKLTVDLQGFGGWPGGDPVVRTNIINEDPNESKGSVVNIGGTALTNVNPLTATSEAIRVVKMKVEIYNSGDYALSKDPLVVMETTKGE